MIYGRWKSLEFLLCARKSMATSNMVTATILNPLMVPCSKFLLLGEDQLLALFRFGLESTCTAIS